MGVAVPAALAALAALAVGVAMATATVGVAVLGRSSDVNGARRAAA